MNRNRSKDRGALINGLIISALSSCIMLSAVGMYRLTSSANKHHEQDGITPQYTDAVQEKSSDTETLKSESAELRS